MDYFSTWASMGWILQQVHRKRSFFSLPVSSTRALYFLLPCSGFSQWKVSWGGGPLFCDWIASISGHNPHGRMWWTTGFWAPEISALPLQRNAELCKSAFLTAPSGISHKRWGWVGWEWPPVCLCLCSPPSNGDCLTIAVLPLYLLPFHWN